MEVRRFEWNNSQIEVQGRKSQIDVDICNFSKDVIIVIYSHVLDGRTSRKIFFQSSCCECSNCQSL